MWLWRDFGSSPTGLVITREEKLLESSEASCSESSCSEASCSESSSSEALDGLLHHSVFIIWLQIPPVQITRSPEGGAGFSLWCYVNERENGRCIQGPLGQSCSVVSDSVKVCKYRSAMFPFGCFIFLKFFFLRQRIARHDRKAKLLVPPSPSLVLHAATQPLVHGLNASRTNLSKSSVSEGNAL